MSCDKANNCKKYKMNIGNPNDLENPCNHCHYNISDYDIVYNKAIDDFAEKLLYQQIIDKSVVRRVREQLKAGVKK